MKKSRFTEEQITFALRQAERALVTSVARLGGGARGPHRDAPSRAAGGGRRPSTVRSP
jgi:hypothetical protein